MSGGKEDQLEKEIKELKEKIKKKKEGKHDTTLSEVNNNNDDVNYAKFKLKLRRTLKGHLAKIYAMHWSMEREKLVSASQDGKLLVWDALTTNKLHAVHLRSSWVMTCAYSPSNNFVACGGLDNICSVYNLQSKEANIKVCRELNAHSGYLSCCRFLSDERIITSSGDTTCILWDLVNDAKLQVFNEHVNDIMSISVNPVNNDLFVSGACDHFAKIWDLGSGKCVSSYTSNESDINSVQYLPNGLNFVTGCDDGTCHLFDIRADRELMDYTIENNTGDPIPVTSLALSKSAKFLFAGYDDHTCHMFDTLKGVNIQTLDSHNNRVSCIGMNYDGTALCTGSWDCSLKIWA
jgi:guanine nucleotide-binding protein G(I)/G(S)/G(T) subunit beta-1